MASPSLQPRTPPPARRRRRWWLAVPIVLLAGAGLFAIELPWILRQPAARRLLKARADAILAPASVEFNDLILSWRRPTALRGVTLRDKQGSAVLVAEVASFDWNLWQILFARPKTATLSFPGGVLDVQRAADGTINLYEALEPILRDKPQRELVIKINHGRLTIHDHAFPEPFVAESADILLTIAADPGPVTWNVVLAHGPVLDPYVDHTALELAIVAQDTPPGRIEVKGSYTRPADEAAGEGDVTLFAQAMEWKWDLSVAGLQASGELDVDIEAGHYSGRSASSGTATIRKLSVTRAGAGTSDAFRMDTVRAAWEVEGGKDRWTAHRLELAAPLGAIAAHRGGSPEPRWLEGDLRVVADASYTPPSDRLAIDRFSVTTPYGRLDGSGTIDQLEATPQVDLKGSLDPDWSRVQSMLVRDVEPNARIAGRSRPWTLAGPIVTGSGQGGLDGLHGELGVQLDALDIFGMRLGATAMVVRAEGGKLSVDPIEARLNEGRLHIEPHWVQERDGSFRITLGPSTTLENAVINDEVSHRVLSYAAPVLDGATRVQGRVSLRNVDAELPLFAAGGVRARLEGDVLFDEVRCMPGPLADDLLKLFPNADADRPLLTLRDPVSLRITEGKVYQQGLKVPLAQVGAVALEGSVDFQKNLDLVARFTLNPPLAADKPLLASALRAARLEVPIRGTLDDPRIDTQAFEERLKAMGSDLLENSLGIGAEGLMRFLQGMAARRQARLADPNRPPPPTPEERRELRQERRRERIEKKAERRRLPRE